MGSNNNDNRSTHRQTNTMSQSRQNRLKSQQKIEKKELPSNPNYTKDAPREHGGYSEAAINSCIHKGKKTGSRVGT